MACERCGSAEHAVRRCPTWSERPPRPVLFPDIDAGLRVSEARDFEDRLIRIADELTGGRMPKVNGR